MIETGIGFRKVTAMNRIAYRIAGDHGKITHTSAATVVSSASQRR
jgi:hypothetical protein